ncbi:MAG TPA: hypothetical protein VFN97_15575 [Actinospica sp.]|nr:hypothetical protein [Actinospica sp.]
MGTFRNPVGPLPASVYWRRRLVLLGIPLFVIALVAYACTGTSGSPQNTAGPGAGHTASSSPTGVITPGASETASGPPGNSYPTGPSNSGSAGAGSGGTGSASAGASAGSSAGASAGTTQVASGAAAGCALSLTIALDQTSSSGTVQYAAGTYPTFKITASDSGSANCTVDVSGKGLVVSVMPLGTTKPIWSSAVCSSASDLRVLGPGDAQTYPVVWKRWETQGTTCPVSKLPTVPQGTYTVNAEADGITTSAVEFILN